MNFLMDVSVFISKVHPILRPYTAHVPGHIVILNVHSRGEYSESVNPCLRVMKSLEVRFIISIYLCSAYSYRIQIYALH